MEQTVASENLEMTSSLVRNDITLLALVVQKMDSTIGSCLLWVMSTEISVDIAVDITVDTPSILGRHLVDSRSTLGRQSIDIAVDSRSIVGR